MSDTRMGTALAPRRDETAVSPDAVTTGVDRLRKLGGGGLPEPALDIFDAYQRRQHARNTDTRISNEYRLQQQAEDDDATDCALRAATEAEKASEMKAWEARRGVVVGKIVGTKSNHESSFETSDAQRERIGRQTREAVMFQADLLVASTGSDPEDLRDLLEETIVKGRPNEIRRLAQMTVGRLSTLAEAKVPGASDAHKAAAFAYRTWKARNPSLAAQLRELDAEREGIEARITKKYQKARDHFRFGAAAHGMRL